MSAALTPLLQFQRFFLPGLIALCAWACWRLVVRRDFAVGLALYLGLVIIVDGYLNTGIYLPGFAKGSIRYSEVCAFFLLINRPAGPPAASRGRSVALLVFVYFGLLFVAALRAAPLTAGLFEFRRIAVPQIIAFLVAARGLGAASEHRRFFLLFTAVVVAIGLFSFWDVFFDRSLIKSEMLYKPEYWMNRKQGRFGSVFLNPNYMGAFVVLVFPAAFIQAMGERNAWVRLYLWVGVLALVFSLVETQSRGPLLAFCVTLLAIVLMPGGAVSRRRRLGVLALFVLAFTIVMPGFYQRAIQRFVTIDKESSVEEVSRTSVWKYTQRIIADHPFGGIGFGETQFIRAMEDYGFKEEYRSASLDNPHNSYLQAAVYAGVPAVAAFLLANGALLLKARRPSLRGEALSPVIFGIAVGLLGFLAVIYPDMHLFTQTVAPVYWVFFSLLLALVERAPEEAVP